MDSDKIEKLYIQYEILAESKDPSQHEEVYRTILASTQGNAKEKKLVCQFIPKFFPHYPQLSKMALEAYFDLCEDNDVAIRKEAIKGLAQLCREMKQYTKRIADILAQLLQATDSGEVSIVRESLITVIKSDPVSALKGVFNQIKNGDDKVREKTIKFLATRVRRLPSSTFSPEVQDVFIAEIKETFQDATSEEIPLLFGLLLWTRLGKNTVGRKLILDIVLSYLEADKAILIVDERYSLKRFITFAVTAKTLFTSDINSNKYLVFFCKEVLPKFMSITGAMDGSGCAIALLKLLAEVATYSKDLKDIDDLIDEVFAILTEFLPCPSEDEQDVYKRLQFSSVECLLYTLHHMMRASPTYFSDKTEKLKDFRIRLLYFFRASQAYVKTLEDALKKKKKDDEDRVKIVALKTISNINTLIKDFFHNPPSQKSSIVLSWLSTENFPAKRKATSANRGEKILKGDDGQHTYQPPIGKYSQNLWPNLRLSRFDKWAFKN